MGLVVSVGWGTLGVVNSVSQSYVGGLFSHRTVIVRPKFTFALFHYLLFSNLCYQIGELKAHVYLLKILRRGSKDCSLSIS